MSKLETIAGNKAFSGTAPCCRNHNHLGYACSGISTKGQPQRVLEMKYPYKTPEQIQRCAELQSKANSAAINIKYAYNKKRAVRAFLITLYLSI